MSHAGSDKVPLYSCITCNLDSVCWPCANHCHKAAGHHIGDVEMVKIGVPTDCCCEKSSLVGCQCQTKPGQVSEVSASSANAVQRHLLDLGAVDAIAEVLYVLIGEIGRGFSFAGQAAERKAKIKLSSMFDALDTNEDRTLSREEIGFGYLCDQLETVRGIPQNQRPKLIRTLLTMDLGEDTRQFELNLGAMRDGKGARDEDARVLSDMDEAPLSEIRDAVQRARDFVDLLDKDHDNQISRIEWEVGALNDWQVICL